MPRRIAVVLWNVAGVTAGALLIGAIGEAWVRHAMPFVHSESSWRFVPEVGWTMKPRSQVRHTNLRDFWTTSRTNSWGFLDREPPLPDRARASCHVAVVGDSFVEAKQVAIADKLQVRLEVLARRSLPGLDVTTSAFGIGDTGQINQLALYDTFARRLRPRLLVLVFVRNDWHNNIRWSGLMPAGAAGQDDDRPRQWLSLKGPDGAFKLIPPTDRPYRLPVHRALLRRVDEAAKRSWFYRVWLSPSTGALRRALSARPQPRWFPNDAHLAAMGFALDQFKVRAVRDGAHLIAFATYSMQEGGGDKLRLLAAARDIPVIDGYEHIVQRGGSPADVVWRHDRHWNPTGHQWAAEALAEYLREHRQVCETSEPGIADAATMAA